MMSDDTYLYDLLPLQHEPVRPPRKGHLGEHVYADAWRKLMAIPLDADAPLESRLASVLTHMPYLLEQRHATVAASMVCWLGTNCGLSFLLEAREAASGVHAIQRGDAYLRIWARQNKRLNYLNHGFRTIEHFLAPEALIDTGSFGRGLKDYPPLSTEDYEVCECVVMWLADPDGQDFLAHCEAELSRASAAIKFHLSSPELPV